MLSSRTDNYLIASLAVFIPQSELVARSETIEPLLLYSYIYKKNKMRNYLKFSVLTLLLTTIMAAPTVDNTQTELALQAVVNGTADFSNAFYDVVSKANPGNLICSPFSADVVLAMTSFGAGGNTATQFKSGLRLPEENFVKAGYQNLIETLNNVKDVQLSVANKIYTMEGYAIKDEFKDVTKTHFLSESETVNFADNVAAANKINAWCSQQTHDRIKEILKSDDLNPLTRLVLLNAVYFKGNWAEQFNPNNTQDADFHIDSKTTKKVPTMFKKGNVRYGVLDDLKASFVELPYKGEELSMVIILPDEIEGLAAVEEKLKTYKISDILSRGYVNEVSVYLPKFRIESTMDLKQPLTDLGMSDMFSDSTADFSNMTPDPNNGLYVSKVIQKAFIEVNEEGSEAAAVTAVEERERSIERTTRVRINRPFLFAIVKIKRVDNKVADTLPIFVGKVIDLEAVVMKLRSMTYPRQMRINHPFYFAIVKADRIDKNKVGNVATLFVGRVTTFDATVDSSLSKKIKGFFASKR